MGVYELTWHLYQFRSTWVRSFLNCKCLCYDTIGIKWTEDHTGKPTEKENFIHIFMILSGKKVIKHKVQYKGLYVYQKLYELVQGDFMLWGTGNLLSLLIGHNYFSLCVCVCTFPLWSYQMYIIVWTRSPMYLNQNRPGE